MAGCPQCSCPTTEHQQRCVVCGNELRMVPLRVDGRPGHQTSRGLAPITEGRGRVSDRVRSAVRRRISVAELALCLVLASLVASISVGVVR